MRTEADELRILRLQNAWANRYTLLRYLMIQMFFGSTRLVLEQSGLVVARVHMLLSSIDFETPSKGRK